MPGEDRERFVIEGVAGTGGMGTVYRARDRASGALVALKVVRGANVDVARFEREARTLASIDDPGVVAYVAHGFGDDGAPWLAMEWLEGEDLAARLLRGPLGSAEVVALATRVSRTLGALHARGVVHRDLKPSNLYLPGGDVASAKLLDFGVARRVEDATRLTHTGVVVGTPAYMSPEQARGEALEACSDVFAFGSVLHECLAGRPPFAGDNAIAVLARILVEEAPPLDAVRPDTPRALVKLVSRMLAKERRARPRDGAQVFAEIQSLADAESPHSIALPRVEIRVLTVVLGGATTGTAETLGAGVERTIDRDVRAIAEACRARLELMGNGAVLAIFSGAGAAGDLARSAALFALRCRPLFGATPFVIATGRAIVSRPVPIGEVLERAVAALESAAPGTILLDATTASVLEGAFEIREVHGRLELGEARSGIEPVRRVLGYATPCVGRERELAGLSALVDECFAEPVARAALVVAPAGMGKSRLVNETLRSLRLRRPDARIAIARASRVGEGSAYGLASELLRQLGVEELATRLSDADAARDDPHTFAESARTAWIDALRIAAEGAPLVLVLEDLHWGDLPSTALLDATLARLGDRPIAIVATGRPEIDSTFPVLWSKHAIQVLRLGAIARRASERLVRSILADLEPRAVEAVLARAEGHPFFLEEILRAIAAGASPDVMPDTVLGTLQLRLDALSADERDVLRAAAVFGETFWKGGVAALLPRSVDVVAGLQKLLDSDLVERAARASLAGEEEYALRHGLVRDAAYALVSDEERARSHALAGVWLEQAGLADPSVLAEHFDRGGVRDRAFHELRRAAQAALDGYDLARAGKLLDRARTYAASDEQRAELDALDADVAFGRGEVATTTSLAERALAGLPPGSRPWLRAASLVITSAGNQGDNDRVERWGLAVTRSTSHADARGERLIAIARAVGQLAPANDPARSSALRVLFGELSTDLTGVSPHALGVVHRARSFHAIWCDDDIFTMRRELGAAIDAFEHAGARGDRLTALALRGMARACTGDLASAERDFDAALRAAEQGESPYAIAFVRMQRGVARAAHGGGREVLDDLTPWLGVLRGSERLTFHARHVLALAALSAGDARRALDESIRAGAANVNPLLRSRALAVEAEAHLALGAVALALDRARESVALDSLVAGTEICAGHPQLALAEALEASGDREAAREAGFRALARLHRFVASAPTPEERAATLAIPIPHAKIVAFAARLGPSATSPDPVP